MNDAMPLELTMMLLDTQDPWDRDVLVMEFPEHEARIRGFDANDIASWSGLLTGLDPRARAALEATLLAGRPAANDDQPFARVLALTRPERLERTRATAAASTSREMTDRGIVRGDFLGDITHRLRRERAGTSSYLVYDWRYDRNHPPGWVLGIFVAGEEEPRFSKDLPPSRTGFSQLHADELGFTPADVDLHYVLVSAAVLDM